jgi:hypothetical protein
MVSTLAISGAFQRPEAHARMVDGQEWIFRPETRAERKTRTEGSRWRSGIMVIGPDSDKPIATYHSNMSETKGSIELGGEKYLYKRGGWRSRSSWAVGNGSETLDLLIIITAVSFCSF